MHVLCTFAPLHGHMYRTAVKPQFVVQEVQVTTCLHRHAMIDTSRLHCCVFRRYLIQSERKHDCQASLACQELFLFRDTKSVSGATPGLLAGRVFSCQIVLLLRRSDMEAFWLICMSCAHFAPLHGHMYRTAVKPQSVVQEVQVTTGLQRHAMLDTYRLHCCVFRRYLIQSERKQDCRASLVCQEPFLFGGTKSVSGAPPGLLAGRVFSCQIALLLRSSGIHVLCTFCTSPRPHVSNRCEASVCCPGGASYDRLAQACHA